MAKRMPPPPPLPPEAPQKGPDGRFLPGHRLSVGHTNRGNRNRIFQDGEELYAAWLEYTAHVDANPYKLPKQAQYKGRPVELEDKQMKAYSITGFLKFHGIWFARWGYWRKGEKARPDLHEAMDQIEAEIYDHKHGGATAGVLNAVFVARDLKIADKIETSLPEGAGTVAFTIMPIASGTFLPPDDMGKTAVPAHTAAQAAQGTQAPAAPPNAPQPPPAAAPTASQHLAGLSEAALAATLAETRAKADVTPSAKVAPPTETDPNYRQPQEQRWQWNEITQAMELVTDADA